MKRFSLGLLLVLLTVAIVYGSDGELPSAPQTAEVAQGPTQPLSLSSVAAADAAAVVQACYDKRVDIDQMSFAFRVLLKALPRWSLRRVGVFVFPVNSGRRLHSSSPMCR
jgi:hypothetical protein